MLAYMSRESLQKTVETGQTWFWSRSRSELWNKGATSGHVQQVKSISYDCDHDALLVAVEQTGAACHTGEYTCFFAKGAAAPLAEVRDDGGMRLDILRKLTETIEQRFLERPEGAYTTYLFEKGLDKILKKVGEETAEVIIAAKNDHPDELASEAGDLIYHLLVLLRQQGVPFGKVLDVLEQRHGAQDIPNKSK
jgi:phosphoribosyl-ATP pyrophosphohydrolase/phosphoribosyl-AMP cyclohydrolase